MSLIIEWINNINESLFDGQVGVAQFSIILALQTTITNFRSSFGLSDRPVLAPILEVLPHISTNYLELLDKDQGVQAQYDKCNHDSI